LSRPEAVRASAHKRVPESTTSPVSMTYARSAIDSAAWAFCTPEIGRDHVGVAAKFVRVPSAVRFMPSSASLCASGDLDTALKQFTGRPQRVCSKYSFRIKCGSHTKRNKELHRRQFNAILDSIVPANDNLRFRHIPHGMQPFIRLGDTTSHGGTVLEGFATYSVDGIPVAGLGHKVMCPRCKGAFPIVECLSHFTVEGVGVSVQGMRTGCGAVLIASQGRAQADDVHGAKITKSAPDLNATVKTLEKAAAASLKDAGYDLFFHLKQAKTGQSLANVPYRITLDDGREFEGFTDENGFTEKVNSSSAQIAKLEAPYYGDDSATYPDFGSDACGC